MIAHVMGLPVEESVLQLGAAGAVTMTAVAVAGRSTVSRFLNRMRRR
jgi:NADPH:quinone reductase-like Zn-dependent oxidoreductase